LVEVLLQQPSGQLVGEVAGALLPLGKSNGGLGLAVREVEVKDGLSLLEPLLTEACADLRGVSGVRVHGNLLGEEVAENYSRSSYPAGVAARTGMDPGEGQPG
jgi:hypothetical protein